MPAALENTQPLLSADAPAAHSKRLLQKNLLWAELPEWMRDNQYILGGYRQPTNSFRKCFASLLYLHNETGNIMTHLVGAMGFLVLCFTVTKGLLLEFPTIDWHDITTLYAFLIAAVGCMGLSALYHTVTCHSPRVHNTYSKCDYIGIVFLIVGSCVPIFCYMFYCHPRLKLFYLALIFTLGSMTVVTVVAPHFAKPDYRPLRAATFVALGLSGIVPAIHCYLLFGWDYTLNAVQASYMLGVGGNYIVGAAIYGARIPERWWPGRFDYWLHSHQIFHIFVIIAAVFHYMGVVHALRWTHTAGIALCSV
ncbi:putative hemolysin-III channel protein Izh2 [Coemansia spiralis]|nr:putative hemolysin-III channel protein Izh2 [Coemansia spiralis]